MPLELGMEQMHLGMRVFVIELDSRRACAKVNSSLPRMLRSCKDVAILRPVGIYVYVLNSLLQSRW